MATLSVQSLLSQIHKHANITNLPPPQRRAKSQPYHSRQGDGGGPNKFLHLLNLWNLINSFAARGRH